MKPDNWRSRFGLQSFDHLVKPTGMYSGSSGYGRAYRDVLERALRPVDEQPGVVPWDRQCVGPVGFSWPCQVQRGLGDLQLHGAGCSGPQHHIPRRRLCRHRRCDGHGSGIGPRCTQWFPVRAGRQPGLSWWLLTVHHLSDPIQERHRVQQLVLALLPGQRPNQLQVRQRRQDERARVDGLALQQRRQEVRQHGRSLGAFLQRLDDLVDGQPFVREEAAAVVLRDAQMNDRLGRETDLVR